MSLELRQFALKLVAIEKTIIVSQMNAMMVTQFQEMDAAHHAQ